IVSADDVARRKPAPDIYEKMLAVLRVSAEACVAFEDSENGLRAARAAGLMTIVTPTRWTMAQDFTGADLLLRGLGDPGAPMHEGDAQAVGAEQVGIAQLRKLHEVVLRRRGLAPPGGCA
ncbi:MAG: HAD family hydrolase, partial [Burkholderiales bacterium]